VATCDRFRVKQLQGCGDQTERPGQPDLESVDVWNCASLLGVIVTPFITLLVPVRWTDLDVFLACSSRRRCRSSGLVVQVSFQCLTEKVVNAAGPPPTVGSGYP